MTFKNHGADTIVQMGFPFSAGDSQSDEPINPNFRTWVDGKKVAITKKVASRIHYKKSLILFQKRFLPIRLLLKRGKQEILSTHIMPVVGSILSVMRSLSMYLEQRALWKGTIENLIIHLKIHAKQARNIHCVLPTEHGAEAKGEELTL